MYKLKKVIKMSFVSVRARVEEALRVESPGVRGMGVNSLGVGGFAEVGRSSCSLLERRELERS